MPNLPFGLQDFPLGSLKPAEYHSLARKIREGEVAGIAELGLCVLSSFSFSFLESFLVVEAAREGFFLSTRFGPFGQIEQPLIDPTHTMWDHEPGLLLIALRIEDNNSDAFLRISGADRSGLLDSARESIDRLRSSIELFRKRSDAPVLVANFVVPQSDVSSQLLDASNKVGSQHLIATANQELALMVHDMAGAAVWDYAGLVSARGAASWTDPRLWFLARQPISAINQPFVASHLMRTAKALLLPPAKCLVLDLDNTLWGGAAGDDGMDGIDIGDDYPGSVFKAFQRAVLALMDRGILLAIVSKNDESVVRQIFDCHPDMLIDWKDFAAVRVNWSSKSSNLLEIASELKIGLDALVLFDDNPVERGEVRINAPEVRVIDVPASPLGYQEALFASGHFESDNVSLEDSRRSQLYRDEARRMQCRNAAETMDSFLRGLEMKSTVGTLAPESIRRASQLIGKTNQFNLTTRRHTMARLQKMADSDDWEIRWLRLADRFGDAGLVGISIVHFEDGTATIDSLVMSCRVMNRQVETAIVCDIIDRARRRECSLIVGEYIPTERNAIAESLYLNSGFSASNCETGRSQLFEFDLTRVPAALEWPESLERISVD